MTMRHYVSTKRRMPETRYYRLAVSFNRCKDFVSDWTFDVQRMFDFIGHFLVHRNDIKSWIIESFDGEIVGGDHMENCCTLSTEDRRESQPPAFAVVAE